MFFIWRFLGNTTQTIPPATTGTGDPFGVPATTRPDGTTSGGTGGEGTEGGTANNSRIRIVTVSDKPVAGAMIVQTSGQAPSTVARYMQQEDGHVYDLPLDVEAGTPRPVSNATIPGVQRTFWVSGGRGVLAQYVEGDHVVKTAYIGFASGTSSQERIQFLPDNIGDIAVSPSGAFIIYLMHPTNGGTTGYLAKSDGSDAKILFSVPLAQTLVSWPATSTILLQTKSTSGLDGVVFAVNSTSGVVAPLLFGGAITASANNAFSRVVFSTVGSSNAAITTYARDVKAGNSVTFSSSVLPEKCAWSNMNNTVLYCARPFGTMVGGYLDSLHVGAVPETDYITVTSTLTGDSIGIAVPGSKQGGRRDRISNILVSRDDRYILYTNQSDRSLQAIQID